MSMHHPSGTAIEILYQVLTAGGTSIDPATGRTPESGYMVSLPDHERTWPLSTITLADIDAYLTGIPTGVQGAYVGAWVDDGTVYLDVSVNLTDRQAAIDAGKAYRQLAIYDLAAAESVRLAPVPA